MPSGGHARSGPQADPNSLNSARKGLVLTSLPADGYRGTIPEFPLPAPAARGLREQELWMWAWRSPQATAWIKERWRWHSVAMWVRMAALCESDDATAADKNALHRFADQIGLTPAGLRFNGWRITPDQEPKPAAANKTVAPSARDRFKVIDGGGAA